MSEAVSYREASSAAEARVRASTGGPPPHDRRGPLRPNRLASVRTRLPGRTVARTFQAGDALSVAGLALGSAATIGLGDLSAIRMVEALPFILASGVWLWVLRLLDTYALGHREAFLRHSARVCAAAVTAGLAMVASLVLMPIDAPLEAYRNWFWASALVLLALHGLWWLMVRRWRKQGRLTPNIVIVGATASAERLIEAALATGEAAVLGVFDDRLARAPANLRGVPVLGDTEALLGHRVMPYVDKVVITVTSSAQARVRTLIERLSVLPNEVTLFMDVDGEAGASALARIADAPLAKVSGVDHDEQRATAKRVQDLVIGSIALVCALPIMAAVAIAIRLDSPGPILFRQRRHGFNNEEIVVWKFRSMRHDAADARAHRQVSAGDDRVTKVGRFIRRTSLDELPQIFNVLSGEMSLVGPRPHAVGMKTGDFESARLVAEYAHRHRMKPGMTGWAAIHGSRGPVDTPESVRRRVALDVEYIERQSFRLDLYIMIMTIPCLLGDSEVR